MKKSDNVKNFPNGNPNNAQERAVKNFPNVKKFPNGNSNNAPPRAVKNALDPFFHQNHQQENFYHNLYACWLTVKLRANSVGQKLVLRYFFF